MTRKARSKPVNPTADVEAFPVLVDLHSENVTPAAVRAVVAEVSRLAQAGKRAQATYLEAALHRLVLLAIAMERAPGPATADEALATLDLDFARVWRWTPRAR